MKHSFKITLILISMFLVAQLIGIGVSHLYSPQNLQSTVYDSTSGKNLTLNFTTHNLPYGLEPPQELEPQGNLISIIIAFIIAISIMFFLMKFNAEIFLRIWFFVVVILALSVTIFAPLQSFSYTHASLIALAISVPLAYLKIFKRNLIIHNLTELLIYPGIAAIFIPLLTISTTSILFIVFSLYDMYAVWHAKFMQKMAKYQMDKVKVFSGFFIPYLSGKDKIAVNQTKNSKKKQKTIKVSVAILGGGDVVFPIILAGVVLQALGFIPALLVAVGATLGLAFLFKISEKGKFYPALPFIAVGCFIGLGLGYLI
jgi:presenilin-like A22 family membrane protease